MPAEIYDVRSASGLQPGTSEIRFRQPILAVRPTAEFLEFLIAT